MTTLPRWADLVLIPALNLLLAFLVAGLVVVFIGEDPIQAVKLLLVGSLGSSYGIGFTLYYATTFVFTGLSVAIAYHAGLFNIGSEGQAALGGIGVTLVCLAVDWPVWWLALPVAILGAGAFGAAWAFIPGYLQAKRGSHVVITTIMFNFIASALVVYLLVNVLKVPGQMAPETRNFPEGTFLPFMHEILAVFGIKMSKTPMNLTSILALVAAFLTWVLVWRTRLGYEMRAFGHSEPAAVYAGIDPVRITIIAMMISGAMAGMMALNVVMGFQHRLVLDYVGGAGFVGIAVSLMGRSHPVGVVLAAILFGILYQGGAELAFDMPKISRDMIVVIQALVILFTGALENLVRAPVERAFLRLREAGGLMDLDTILQLAGSSLRLATPLLLACLAGLYSERAGIFDIGLEGKMLAAAFAAGAFAAVTGSAWIGLLAGIAASSLLSLLHGFASITLKGNQLISGVAINFLASGLTALIGQNWFGLGGQTPQLQPDQRFLSLQWPFAETLGAVPVIGPIYQYLISGHNILVYVALLAVPLTWWVLYRTRFGLRLRAVGENPSAVDTAGVSVVRLRYAAVLIAGLLCGIAGAYLSTGMAAGFNRDMTAGKGFIALAALIFAKWRPWPALGACLLFGALEAIGIRYQAITIPGLGVVPVQFMQALPYILTVIILAGFVGKAIPPKAGGRPYVKER